MFCSRLLYSLFLPRWGVRSRWSWNPTTNKGKIAKGKQPYTLAVEVLSGRALAVATDVQDRNGRFVRRER